MRGLRVEVFFALMLICELRIWVKPFEFKTVNAYRGNLACFGCFYMPIYS